MPDTKPYLLSKEIMPDLFLNSVAAEHSKQTGQIRLIFIAFPPIFGTESGKLAKTSRIIERFDSTASDSCP
jgi:hypothetical protein